MSLVQAFGNLTTTQVVFAQQLIDMADDLGLPRLDYDMRRGIVPFREIAIAITLLGPRYICAAPGFLETSPSGALKNLRALILGNHPLHLGE
jgi:hypothetical protein